MHRLQNPLNLQFQEMGAALTVVTVASRVRYTSVSFDNRLVGRDVTNGQVADRLYGLTSHHQRFMMGHFGAKAAPLLCLLLGF